MAKAAQTWTAVRDYEWFQDGVRKRMISKGDVIDETDQSFETAKQERWIRPVSKRKAPAPRAAPKKAPQNKS
jgi:hypothetical protein